MWERGRRDGGSAGEDAGRKREKPLPWVWERKSKKDGPLPLAGRIPLQRNENE